MADSFLGPNNPRNFTFDALLQLRDAVAMTASGAMQVGGSNKIVDLGAGLVEGNLVLDVSAIDVSSTDESYTVYLEGSNASDFSSGIVPLVAKPLGIAVANVRSAASGTGRHVIPFTNEENGTVYRYVRGYVVIAGTTPSITMLGYLALDVL